MYSRITQSIDDIRIPENYDGTAFCDGGKEEKKTKIPPICREGSTADLKISPQENEVKTEEVFAQKHDGKGGFFGFDFGSIFHSLFGKNKRVSDFFDSFGLEEIIIIGLAAFLFLSSSGDIECAIMLLILLFIS